MTPLGLKPLIPSPVMPINPFP